MNKHTYDITPGIHRLPLEDDKGKVIGDTSVHIKRDGSMTILETSITDMEFITKINKGELIKMNETTETTASAAIIEAPIAKEKITIFVKIRWHIRRFFRDIFESIAYFRARRYISKQKQPGVLLMPNLTIFDRPEMYVGTIDQLKLFKKYKIDMLTLENLPFDNPRGTACIGFSSKRQKWYGYSHRAIQGFKIGDVVKIGDCTASSGWNEEGLKEHPERDISLPVGFTAKTLDDCKLMALAFAEHVS